MTQSTPPSSTPSPAPAPTSLADEALAIANKAARVEASPKEILDLKPNKAEDATSGPDPQGKPLSYTTWTRADGSTFIAPADNDETYERKGFKKGKTEEITDLVATLEERAKKEPRASESESESKA